LPIIYDNLLVIGGTNKHTKKELHKGGIGKKIGRILNFNAV
jgi:hypothetical protein